MKKAIAIIVFILFLVIFSLPVYAYEEKITKVDATKKLHADFEITFDVEKYEFPVTDLDQFNLVVWMYDDLTGEYVIVDDYIRISNMSYRSNNGIITKLIFNLNSENSGDLYLKLNKGDKGVVHTNIIRIEAPGVLTVLFKNLGAVVIQPLKMMIYTPLHHLCKEGYLPLPFIKENTILKIYFYLSDHSGLMLLAIIGVIAIFLLLMILDLIAFSKSKTYFAVFLNILTSFFFIVMMAMRTNDSCDLYKASDGYDEYTKNRILLWYTLFFAIGCFVILVSMFSGAYGLFDLIGLAASVAIMYYVFTFLGLLFGLWIVICIISGVATNGEQILDALFIMDYLAKETVDEWFGISRDPYDGIFS